jgi:hypothetical protein
MPVDADKLLQLVELAAGPDATPSSGLAHENEREPPQAGEVPPWRTLTIGLATYDDFDGAYFTIQSIRLYHPEVLDRVAFLVVDNNPGGPAAWDLKAFEHKVAAMRYLPCDDVRGTAVRDLIFREANSEWVLCLDSHVLLEPGALHRLLRYCDDHPGSIDLLQGPIEWDELGGYVSTHMEPEWRAGMFGTWARATRDLNVDGDPFEIPLQGLGLFACRKEAWPGFNPRFRGFGGEEGYLHEKFRARGGHTLCLPFLVWVHRFQRPFGVGYRNAWEDRIRNYLIGWNELGFDESVVVDHFTEHLGAELTDHVVESLEAERRNPFWFFDAIYCINLDERTDRWAQMQRRFTRLGIAERVRRFAAVATPDNHHVGCALSHRGVLSQARAQGLRAVLVLEDDAQFLEGTHWCLRRSLAELGTRSWSILYLGGHKWGRKFELAEGCEALEVPVGMTSGHAVAYHEGVYGRILADVPATRDGVVQWCTKARAFDQYLMNAGIDGMYVTAPVLATQAPIMGQEDPVYRDQFGE